MSAVCDSHCCAVSSQTLSSAEGTVTKETRLTREVRLSGAPGLPSWLRLSWLSPEIVEVDPVRLWPPGPPPSLEVASVMPGGSSWSTVDLLRLWGCSEKDSISATGLEICACRQVSGLHCP